jgi:cation-transporting ATPase 13A2
MAVFVWEGYRIYAGCIFILSALSIFATIYETRKNNEQIRKMAKYVCKVEVMTTVNDTDDAMSDQLVPGDVIKVPEGIVLPCDLVLLTGSAIVNESILTGESIPVMKQSLPVINTEKYSIGECTKYTLFGGTSVIQTR